MRLLFKNISLTKKVEFTLSSKIIQAACLFLFSGSVGKLSFDRKIINEACQLASKLIGMQSIFSFSFYKTLFTWSRGPRSSGVGFFCFVSPRA